MKTDKKKLILDCTMRDGGIINNFDFSLDFFRDYIFAVDQTGCDYCEIGYINHNMRNDLKINFWSAVDFKHIPVLDFDHTVKISVLGDHGKFAPEQIPEKTEGICVDLIRIAGPISKIEQMLIDSNTLSKKGYETSINLMFSSHYKKKDWEKVVSIIEDSEHKPDFLYFADSFGCLLPRDVNKIVNILKKIDHVQVGFHGHNQMQLAFANTIEAMTSGANIVDSTISGMGKGSGNTPTELLLGHLKYNVFHINTFIEKHMVPLRNKCEWGYMHKYLICALHNATSRYGEYIMRDPDATLNELTEKLESIDVSERISYKSDISKTRIAAVVPIKLNNERLPNKNLLNLGGKPLCQYIFSTLLEVKEEYSNLDIYVFCSDEKIREYIPEGIQFLKRDSRLDSNNTNYTEIFKEFSKAVESDVYIYTHATSPFIQSDSIIKAVRKVIVEGYDSCVAAQKKNIFYWQNGEANYNLSKIPRTQDIDPIFVETSGFYIYKKKVFDNNGSRIGKTPYFYNLLDIEAVDIDTLSDFLYAEKLIKFDLGQSNDS